ncbi:hypothetical protein H7A76_30505 [Pseudomonas sp. MSSRFD41]|uniref:hypothetical protein n=1 Tax=Pseudomonas sp. MSSRFD41 TaxID=1310370 RepID=UPI00163AEC58|nr:hypothetical protein [Pseudomonas sp. MSSRFD41]MBC2659787.1 hypothetical protein [Pseudomonas sp. MSSRFD41]
MDTNKMREQFEQWAKDRYSWHLHDDARDPEDRTLASWNGEIYGNRIVEGMWQSWQASREAVEIELPELERPTADGMGALFACKRAIEAQGLRVKP